jgi:hypothetical protein
LADAKRVAIVGFAPHREKAPWTDPTIEKWGCNHLWAYIPDGGHWHRWFDMHSRAYIEKHPTWREKEHPHEKFLKTNHGRPVYMPQAHPDFPSSVAYPLDAVIKKFGPWSDYFTNGIAYQVALAIFEKFEEIQVYGVDMTHDSEYGPQRPCVEAWLGYARGLGISVVMPPESALFKPPDGCGRYGYDEMTGIWAELLRELGNMHKELDEQRDANEQQANQGMANINAIEGARIALNSVAMKVRQRARGGAL